MASKSDSAGKLHQYYTCKSLKTRFPNSVITSPLEKSDMLNFHLELFNETEIKSLLKIGELSAKEISSSNLEPIVKIEDIGVSSGAVGFENTDDIVITLSSGNVVGYSLKCAKGISQVLSKNMGAKSLLKDYFNAPKEQTYFNINMDKLHLTFLNSILNTNHIKISEAKKEITLHATSNNLTKARFGDVHYNHANQKRNELLKSLRDELFNILNGLDDVQLINACNLILDTGKNHILADYRFNKESVQSLSIPIKKSLDVKQVQTRGNDSVTITLKDYVIGFRYKFESGIVSSIKLVGDYKKLN